MPVGDKEHQNEFSDACKPSPELAQLQHQLELFLEINAAWRPSINDECW
jgi:hypothetical protein